MINYGDSQSARTCARIPGASDVPSSDAFKGPGTASQAAQRPAADAYRRPAGGRASVGSAAVGGRASVGSAAVGGRASVGSAAVAGRASVGSAAAGGRASVGSAAVGRFGRVAAQSSASKKAIDVVTGERADPATRFAFDLFKVAVVWSFFSMLLYMGGKWVGNRLGEERMAGEVLDAIDFGVGWFGVIVGIGGISLTLMLRR